MARPSYRLLQKAIRKSDMIMKKPPAPIKTHWDYSISNAPQTEKLAASRDYRRALLIQKAAEWGIGSKNGTALKTDLWNEAIGYDDFAEAILKTNLLCVGVDMSREVVRAAQGRYKVSPNRTRAFFLVADLRLLPFRDSIFDAVYSPSTLDHLPPKEALRAFRELRRALKPRGRALVTIDNLLCLWLYPLVFRIFFSRFSRRMWWPLSPWESERLLKTSGLQIMRRDSILLTPTVGGVLILAQSSLKILVGLMLRVSMLMENRSSILGAFKAENIFVVSKT